MGLIAINLALKVINMGLIAINMSLIAINLRLIAINPKLIPINLVFNFISKSFKIALIKKDWVGGGITPKYPPPSPAKKKKTFNLLPPS